FEGDFLVRGSLSDTPDYTLTEAQQKEAQDIGTVTGTIMHYDLDRDGRDEKLVIARGPWNDPSLRLLIEFDGTYVRVPSCIDSGTSKMEVGLRDLNGDRRPEIWVAYDDRFCILEFKGIAQLAE